MPTRFAFLLLGFGLLAEANPAIAPAALPDAPAGRLFFTPEERNMLDRGGPAAVAAMGTAKVSRFDGMLGTRDRKPILWVNGQLVTGNKAGEYTIESLVGQTLTLSKGKKTIRLKPGQRIDVPD